MINLNRLKKYSKKLPPNNKLSIENYSILCIPKTTTKVLIRFGNVNRTMHPIKMQ
jgi:hypothetical protein